MIHVIAYEIMLVVSDYLFTLSAIVYSDNLLGIVNSTNYQLITLNAL
jgi:hypothetical protein